MSTTTQTRDPGINGHHHDDHPEDHHEHHHFDHESTVVTDPRQQKVILGAMSVALVAVVASVSGLNVAQQQIALDLGASQGQILWIINGYTLALAALLMPVGAIGDRWGRRPVLLTGLVLFTLSNVAAGLAGSVTALLAARVLAGVGAAMIMPVTLSVITSSFPASERARAVGVWAGFAGAGGIIGLFTSSFLIDYFTWPWLFALPAALALASIGPPSWRCPTPPSTTAAASTRSVRCSRRSPSGASCSGCTRAPNRAGPTWSPSRRSAWASPRRPGSPPGSCAAAIRCST